MRVVYVVQSYLPDSIAGTEMYTNALATYMHQQGHEVFVVLPNFEWDPAKNVSYTFNDIPVITYHEPSQSSRDIILGLQKTEGLSNFTNTIKNLNPDIVHFQMISSGASISLFHLEEVKKLGIRTVLTMHLSHYSCLTNNLLQNNRKTCDGIIKKSKCSICYIHNKNISLPLSVIISSISNIAVASLKNPTRLYDIPFLGVGLHIIKKQEQLQKIVSLIDKICVITNWYKTILLKNNVPEEKIVFIKQGFIHSNESPAVNLKNEKLKLIFIGRISEFKGLHLLLKALKNIDSGKYLLNVYGKFDTTDKYFKKWNTFSTNHNMPVYFKGAIDHNDIMHVLPEHDFLCLPSLFSEMSPLVIQEAFQAGIPVIGSNVPGIIEEVKHMQNGLIFPFGNHIKLQKLLFFIITHRDIKEKMIMNITPPRSFDYVGQETLDVYYNLTK
jgi:glycosyltransferase involved in cell wall biosynthesis